MHEPSTDSFQITISAYGVRVRIGTNRKELVPSLKQAVEKSLANNFRFSTFRNSAHALFLTLDSEGCRLSKDNEIKYSGPDIPFALDRLESELRLTVAENARNRAFIHAGAVSWDGKGVIFPARSFRGKSTLTAALVRLGARYYSDEYAVLDERGRLHPFAKDLSLRGRNGGFEQVETSVESIGGKEGKRPVPVKLVVITEFKANARWRSRQISSGSAVMELINNSVSIRRNPAFVMPTLTTVANNAVAIRTKRGDAEIAARKIIELIEMET
jgi:hypothetical protein